MAVQALPLISMKHFITLTDWSAAELQHLLALALKLKREFLSGGNRPLLRGKSLAMVFQRPSLRTRVSFEMGMIHLGGTAMMLSPQEVKMGERESPADVARVLSGYASGIMARVVSHADILELADYATVPVINGLSDYNHPAQALTDLLTMLEHTGSLDGLKVAYIGDGNNVARSLLWGAMMTGVDLRLGFPAGYGLTEDDLDTAERLREGQAAFKLFANPYEAVHGVDVVYTDVWVSMGHENETDARLQAFHPYQVNRQLVAAAGSNAVVMHCLPAHRGQEISADVADGPRSVIFAQAENRLHAQKAILATLLAGLSVP